MAQSILHDRAGLKRFKSRLAMIQDRSAEHILLLVVFEQDTATVPGPTASGSMLAMRGIAALGAVAYRAWRPRIAEAIRELDSGRLRAATRASHRAVRREIRLHQELLVRMGTVRVRHL
jgi:hypothetical protein